LFEFVTAAVLGWFNSGSKWFTHDILRDKRKEKSDVGVATDSDGEAMLGKDGRRRP
jgi:hypothetical protein